MKKDKRFLYKITATVNGHKMQWFAGYSVAQAKRALAALQSKEKYAECSDWKIEDNSSALEEDGG